MDLIKKAGIDPKKRSYGLETLKILQAYYDDNYPGKYLLVAFSREIGLKPIFKGSGPRKYQIFVITEKGHWDGLKSIKQFFQITHKYCIFCERTYHIAAKHSLTCIIRCPKCCRMGSKFPCKNVLSLPITCQNCNRRFFNETCYEAHKSKICSLYKRCNICEFEFSTENKHICGQKLCTRCNERHANNEHCFIKKIKVPNTLPSYRIISYDCECSSDTLITDGQFKNCHEHRVVFLSARLTCSECVGNVKKCEICGPVGKRHFTWCSKNMINPMNEFLNWALSFKKFQTLVFAHFAGRYDAHFVLRELSNMSLVSELLISDLKIYQIRVRKNRLSPFICFRDFWLMTQNRLSELPKTFGLDVSPKMFFPHRYISEHNWGKLLPELPPMEMYCIETMKEEDFKKFEKWYHENRKTSFLLERELEIYCGNDTEILQAAILKLRNIFLEVTQDENCSFGYDVFKDVTTIAGAAMKIYQAKFLKEKHLAIVPEGGFERADTQSTIAINFFEWIMHRDGIKGRHAANGGEIKIGGFKVDFIMGRKKKIIEFQGCVFHGCPKCYKPWNISPSGKTAQENYIHTQNRMASLREICAKYGLSECDVLDMLNPKKKTYNKEMKLFFENFPNIGPLDPREAYAGGRTQPFCLYAKSDNNIEINMADIVSLYPSVNFFASYPVKTPQIIHSREKNVYWDKPEDLPYEGILKVRAIPPKDLFVPLLPFHSDGLLLFVTCSACAKQVKTEFVVNKNMKKCTHTNEERGITGSFTSPELKKALELGYVIDKFYNAYDFKKFDNGLFKEYVRKFLKLKVEASGWPPCIKSANDKADFIQKYKEIFDISISPHNMQLVPGLRYIAKLLLNSLWGKFSMRNNLSKNKIVNKPSEFFKMVLDPKIELTKPVILHDNMLRVIYKEKSAYVRAHKVSNIIVSLWTTSISRIKLYEWFEKVSVNPLNKILYCDTDSIIYSHPIGENPITFGNLLGEMSHENSENSIIEYVSGGPKQYALKFKNNILGEISYKIKLRGMTLNRRNKIDFEEFKTMVLKYKAKNKKTFEYPDKFGPTRESRMITRPLFKEYKPVIKKGIIDESLNVLPFGFW